MVPEASDDGTAFFDHPGRCGNIWPVLMEKGFAKVVGSYFAMGNGGIAYTSAKAIAQAPVQVFNPDKMDAEEAWENLAAAERNGWPNTAGSKSDASIVPGGHAFCILGVSENYEEHGRSVHVYNPWGASNQYKGSITGQSHDTGGYWMTFEELRANFDMVTIAHMSDGYLVSAVRLPAGKPAAFEFTVTSDQRFSVQLEWPGSSFAPPGCEAPDPARILVAAKKDDLRQFKVDVAKKEAGEAGADLSNARVGFEGGAGTYLVYVSTEFDPPDIDSVVVNVYAAEQVTLAPSDQPDSALRMMLGLDCDEVAWATQGSTVKFKKSAARVRGSPTWTADEAPYTGYVLWFNGEQMVLSPSPTEPDSFLEIGGAEALSCARRRLSRRANASAEGSGDDVQEKRRLASESECAPKWRSRMERLDKLDNAADLGSGSDDPLFPPESASLAPPHKSCGDTAHGIQGSCKKYNHWAGLEETMEKAQRRHETMRKCVDFATEGEWCKYTNKCSEAVYTVKSIGQLDAQASGSIEGTCESLHVLPQAGDVCSRQDDLVQKVASESSSAAAPAGPAPSAARLGSLGALGAAAGCLTATVALLAALMPRGGGSARGGWRASARRSDENDVLLPNSDSDTVGDA
uniref:Calpain catalytic domain-containing protein n=1 Tax=Zooxanthella nutricula TaxID=1333877 RepID=A0A7S2P012_9DINO